MTYLKNNGRLFFRNARISELKITPKEFVMSKKNMRDLNRSVDDLIRRIERLERSMLGKNHAREPVHVDECGEDSIDVVLEVTCKVWKVMLKQLLSKNRTTHLVNARVSAAHLSYKDYGLGNTREIGDRFGGRDHSTISHEVASADNLLATNDLAFCESHNRAKAILDVRFNLIKKNGIPINYQI